MKIPLTVAVSARSLFDMTDSNRIFEESGLEAFLRHLDETKDTPFAPGPAFPLVKALLNLNKRYPSPVVEVIIVSSIQPEAGLRVSQSLKHHQLNILIASFIGAGDIVPFLKAYGTDLFLTRSEEDAQRATNSRIATALMYDMPEITQIDEGDQIRVVFDGDAVVFDASSERIYKASGLAAFWENEANKVMEPLPSGPFAAFFQFIMKLQAEAPADDKPFFVALVTARNALDPALRVMRTFASWKSAVDQTHYLNGRKKTNIVEIIKPHIFLDDQHTHVEPASKVVPAARVPWVSEDETQQNGPADDPADHATEPSNLRKAG